MATPARTWMTIGWAVLGAGLGFLATTQAAGTEPKPVTLVRAAPFSRIAVYPERAVPATVLSLNDSQISAEISARVERIEVLVGDIVDAGASLVQLDCRDYELALRQAEAETARAEVNLELARKQLQRSESLVGRQQISEELLDQRRTELAVARQDLALAKVRHEQARLQTSRCTVRAPFAGVITERLGTVGELATIGTPLLRLLDHSRLEISAQVPVDSIAGLRESPEVWLRTNGERIAVQLRSVVAVLDPRARSAEARFVFGDSRALPGTAGRIVWRAAVAHVPADLVLRRGDELGVFVVDGVRARFVALPQAQEGQPAPASLSADSLVIDEGRYGLVDNDPIEIRR